MTRPATFVPLVVRFGAFGDMVLIIPMLKFLSQRFGHPCEIVCSGPWCEPLLQRVPAAGLRFLLTSRRAPYWFNRSQRRLAAWLRERPPGPVYVFETDEKSHSLLRRGRITPDWICSLRDHPGLQDEHIAAHAIRLACVTPPALRGLPLPAISPPPSSPEIEIRLTDADRSDCQAWLVARNLTDVPLVLVQPGNKKTMHRGSRRRPSNIKYWPEDHWARVIVAVRQTLPSARVLLCGSPAERPLAEDILRRVPADGVIVATDGVPISRLLALEERAHSMISVDTGPAQAAAAMSCPLVVLFDRINRHLYAPLATSSPVEIVMSDDESPDARIASIPPERVIAAWRGLLPG